VLKSVTPTLGVHACMAHFYLYEALPLVNDPIIISIQDEKEEEEEEGEEKEKKE
jgi:hypothetical protein